MTPRALLLRELRHRVVPTLSARGFSLSQAPLALTRDRGDLVDWVRFGIAVPTGEGECQFTSNWAVELASFGRLYFQNWGIHPQSAVIANSQDWLLRGWPRS